MSSERAGQPSAEVELGPIRAGESEPLFELFADVVAAGDGYPQLAPLTRSVFDATWVTPVTAVVAARLAGVLIGAYYLKPNFPGRGAHIANAGYVVDRRHRGAGIGRALVADSIERAPRLGFDAIQFNFVFATNPAREMYASLGFTEIGRIPNAIGPGAEHDAIIYFLQLPPAAG
jgi:GNAT superfamily N-acetyltransferase